MTIPLNGITRCAAFGDSYTVGNWATNLNGYIQRFCSARGLTLTNHAIGGRTCGAVISDVFQYCDPKALNTLLIGINDLRGYPSNETQTMEKIRGTVKSFLATVFTQDVIPFSQAVLNGFTSMDGYGRALRLGGTPRRSGGPLDSGWYVFNGDNIVIGFAGCSSGYPLGRFSVLVDGDIKATVNPMGLSDGENTLMPNIVLITGLGQGIHKLKIIALDAAGTSIDYIATLKPPASCSPAIVLQIPYLSTAGYGAFSSPQLNNAALDAANAIIISAVNEFAGWPVACVPTNDFYIPSIGASTSPDSYHPNDIGHAQMTSAVESVISP